MKMMKCEMCGGTEFTKQEGFYICDSCGLKYSAEEAKKLIVSGTVEVTKGEAEKERLVRNLETYFNLRDFGKAEQVSEQLIKEYPDDYRSWDGYARAVTDMFTIVDFDAMQYSRINQAMMNALRCADASVKDNLREQYLQYEAKHNAFLDSKRAEVNNLTDQLYKIANQYKTANQFSNTNEEVIIKAKRKVEGLSAVVGLGSAIGIMGGLLILGVGFVMNDGFHSIAPTLIIIGAVVLVAAIAYTVFFGKKYSKAKKELAALEQNGTNNENEIERMNEEHNRISEMINALKTKYQI